MEPDLFEAEQLIDKCLRNKEKTLDLGSCGIYNLEDLPNLFQCSHLQSLNLGNQWPLHQKGELKWQRSQNSSLSNEFDYIPSEISNLKNLTKLTICGVDGIQLSDINFLKSLKSLTYLDLSSNTIKDYSPLQQLSNLQSLILRGNQLSNIDFLKNLVKLKFLYLSENRLVDIKDIDSLSNLQSLYLSYNAITSFEPLKKLIRLKSLGLNAVKMRKFEFLKDLPCLESIYLRYNNIIDIGFLRNLAHLKDVDLRDNEIKEVPSFVFGLNAKVRLKSTEYYKGGVLISNNPIESPPVEILLQGHQSVLDWFEAVKKKLNEIKIILIGDPEAGKTSLLRRLKANEFVKNEVQTDGINIEHIHFKACETFKKQTSLHDITAHFWDFGGQEIMNATHQFFLTNRSVYILVLDARKDQGVAAQIREWVKRIKATGGNSPIIVVANQVDVNTGFGFSNESDLQKEFPEIKYFIKASCKTKKGIDEIKEKLADVIPRAELFNTNVDERWIAIKEQLQEETKSEHYLDESRFKEICSNYGLNEKAGRRNAIHFFNDLGLFLHFEELNLAQYYVLDPYWITYGVYQIITSAEAGRLKGIVGMDRLEYIVNEEVEKKDVYKSAHSEKILYDTNQRRFLVDILNQFKLCCYLPGNTAFIIPNLLDTKEPLAVTEPLKNAVDSIKFVYKYEYLPGSILPNIIVDAHSLLTGKWRTGCILIGNGCRALISAYQDIITIVVCGEYRKKREFMAVIRNCIDNINQGLGVKPQMLIPLPDTSPVAYAEYEVLLNREKKGKTNFIFNEDKPDEKTYKISQLLEGIATPDELSEITNRLERIEGGVGIIIGKLGEQYSYLIQRIGDEQISAKIIVALKEISAEQKDSITTEIMQQIAIAFDLFSSDIDEKLEKIYTDLQKTDDIEAKLKLSIPLINLLGIEFGVEWDVKSWATKMYGKYKLKIFELMGALPTS